MAGKPLRVGVTSGHTSDPWQLRGRGLVHAMVELGHVPILLPPSGPCHLALRPMLDAAILADGGDIDTHDQFGRVQESPPTSRMSAPQQSAERLLVARVAQTKTPVLGIGSGMHLLADVLGGTIARDMRRVYPNAIAHADTTDDGHAHAIEVTRHESLLGAVYDMARGPADCVRVLSQHTMAVKRLAEHWVETARCPDGVLEGMEYGGDDWLAVGIQFDPVGRHASRLDIGIIKTFLTRAERFRLT
jgi:gamma-glutamyl-gamma-aminobutyrate hydrolase PuuD